MAEGIPLQQRPIRERHRSKLYRGTKINPDVDWYLDVIKQAATSQQVDDPFKHQSGALGDASGMHIISPPFNFGALLRLPRENNMLRQCIDAMVTNVEGHGWRLEYTGPEEQEESEAAKAEKIMLENLLDFPNDDTTLQELRERVRRDIEILANAFLEVGRDAQNRIVLVSHVPGYTVRLTNKESEAVEVHVTLPREGKAQVQRVMKTFRRFIQIVGTKRVFFKEFGDPRPIDPTTGRVNEELPLEQQATELIHLTQHYPGTPYGIPKWINQMPAILGSRQAELTNLDFFKENAIPAMVLMVAGGSITQESIEDLEEQFVHAKGRASFNRITIIEARGDEEAASQDGNIPSPRMEIKPLQSERQKDALFQVYDKNNMAKIRSSFRLPPIFVGLSEDYTHATASASLEVAESQVFGPERAKTDDIWNMKILSTYSPKFWSFRSLPPRITNSEDVVSAIEKFDTAGALNPNVIIGLANELFDLEIPLIEEPWGDIPFSLTTIAVQAGVEPEEEVPDPFDVEEDDPNDKPVPQPASDEGPPLSQEVKGKLQEHSKKHAARIGDVLDLIEHKARQQRRRRRASA